MRKIKLQLVDSSELFKKVEKEKRFQILISIGEFSYYFSNRQRAERFLTKYNNYLSEYVQIVSMQVGEVTNCFTSLVQYCNYVQSKGIRERLKNSLDLIDKLYTDSNTHNNSAIIHWINLIGQYLLECCNILKTIAKKSRYNQSELYRIKSISKIIKGIESNFYDNYRNFEFKGKSIDKDCKVIQLYDKFSNVI